VEVIRALPLLVHAEVLADRKESPARVVFEISGVARTAPDEPGTRARTDADFAVLRAAGLSGNLPNDDNTIAAFLRAREANARTGLADRHELLDAVVANGFRVGDRTAELLIPEAWHAEDSARRECDRRVDLGFVWVKGIRCRAPRRKLQFDQFVLPGRR